MKNFTKERAAFSGSYYSICVGTFLFELIIISFNILRQKTNNPLILEQKQQLISIMSYKFL